MKGMIIMNKYKKYTKNEIDMLKKHIKLKRKNYKKISKKYDFSNRINKA